MWDGGDFHGAKIALIFGERLVTYKRDNIPSIPSPGMWDLPGGGREGDETPIDCALREVEEEFGLKLDSTTVQWCRSYAGATVGIPCSYFLAAPIDPAQLADVRFGSEGECWEAMRIKDFIGHAQAVPSLQRRLRDWAETQAPAVLASLSSV